MVSVLSHSCVAVVAPVTICVSLYICPNVWASRAPEGNCGPKTTQPDIGASELARQTAPTTGPAERWRPAAFPCSQRMSAGSAAQATAHSTLVKVPMMKRSAAPVSSWLRSSG
jgi:hypothetical protein